MSSWLSSIIKKCTLFEIFSHYSVPKMTEMQYSTEKNPYKISKALLMNKLSKLEIEKLANPELTEQELEKNIRSRGIDYETLIKNHQINKNFQEKVQSSFERFGVQIKNVNKFTCSESDIEWCDAVFPIGGDGTFLNAARRITNRNKPVVGFNSDPCRSEGFLCLPKKYSSDITLAIQKLLNGQFRWMFRTRIRVTIKGHFKNLTPIQLHDINVDHIKISDIIGKEKTASVSETTKVQQKLPILALNEVFMSDIYAAKVSYFEMCLNNCSKSVKVKSSGLCVCTGTGSTSWNLSINRRSRQDIHDILKLYIEQTNESVKTDFPQIVDIISKKFNERFKFDPEQKILGYTIRDLISLRVWPNPKGIIEPRGFAETIEVKSKCLNAAVIVDGGITYPINEGAVTILEAHSEDALRTVVLSE